MKKLIVTLALTLMGFHSNANAASHVPGTFEKLNIPQGLCQTLGYESFGENGSKANPKGFLLSAAGNKFLYLASCYERASTNEWLHRHVVVRLNADGSMDQTLKPYAFIPADEKGDSCFAMQDSAASPLNPYIFVTCENSGTSYVGKLHPDGSLQNEFGKAGFIKAGMATQNSLQLFELKDNKLAIVLQSARSGKSIVQEVDSLNGQVLSETTIPDKTGIHKHGSRAMFSKEIWLRESGGAHLTSVSSIGDVHEINNLTVPTPRNLPLFKGKKLDFGNSFIDITTHFQNSNILTMMKYEKSGDRYVPAVGFGDQQGKSSFLKPNVEVTRIRSGSTFDWRDLFEYQLIQFKRVELEIPSAKSTTCEPHAAVWNSKILVLCESTLADQSKIHTIAALNSAGDLDQSFGHNGYIQTEVAKNCRATSLSTSTGKLGLTCTFEDRFSNSFFFLKY